MLERFRNAGSPLGVSTRELGFIAGVKGKEAAALFSVFDGDHKGVVDAVQTLAALVLVASLELEEKLAVVFGLFDFGQQAALSLDEVVILLHGLAEGAGALNGLVAAAAPPLSHIEAAVKRLFQRTGKTVDDEASLEDFMRLCDMDSAISNALRFVSGAAGLAHIGPGALFEDDDFCDITQVLYGRGAAPESAAQYPLVLGSAAQFEWRRAPADLVLIVPDGSIASRTCPGVLPATAVTDALGMLPLRARLLQRIFVSSGQESSGRFSAQLFHRGQWRLVHVDSRLLCSAQSSCCPSCGRDGLRYLGFGHATDNEEEVWAALLIKALAKLHGSYSALLGLTLLELLETLTGGAASENDLTPLAPAETYQLLHKALANGVAAAFRQAPASAQEALARAEQARRKGLSWTCLYGVAGLKAGFVKLLHVHQCCCEHCAPSAAPVGGPEIDEDGGEHVVPQPQVLWMPIGDFRQVFDSLVTCHVFDPDKWTAHPCVGTMTARGSLISKRWHESDQHCLLVPEGLTKVCVSVYGGTAQPLGSLALAVLEHDFGDVVGHKPAVPVAELRRGALQHDQVVFDRQRRSCSVHLSLQAGKYAVIVLDDRQGERSHYTVVVRTSGHIAFFPQADLEWTTDGNLGSSKAPKLLPDEVKDRVVVRDLSAGSAKAGFDETEAERIRVAHLFGALRAR